MKISKKFLLNKSQFELDFVDIETDRDTSLFLDPYFVSRCDFAFTRMAQNTIRSYFEYLLTLLKNGNIKMAEEIFSHLGEANDICLGMSKGKPRGHGMGPKDTKMIFSQLQQSRAIRTGVMEDIEDFRIFVPNVDKDKVSDMTANIIKKHLIDYTKTQCELLQIPLQKDVPSGMYWDSINLRWHNDYTERLIVEGCPIMLVPKRIVSYTDRYTQGNYKQHFVLNFLQNENLRFQTSLVQKRKDGTRYVTKDSITESEPKMTKDYLIGFTQRHPEVLRSFKDSVGQAIKPVEGNVLQEINMETIARKLKLALSDIPVGTDAASTYHQLMIGILEFLLYPNLSNPIKEKEIHDRRKRIDIQFNNSAERGFFYQLPSHSHITCPFIFIECKNYSRDVANPELVHC